MVPVGDYGSEDEDDDNQSQGPAHSEDVGILLMQALEKDASTGHLDIDTAFRTETHRFRQSILEASHRQDGGGNSPKVEREPSCGLASINARTSSEAAKSISSESKSKVYFGNMYRKPRPPLTHSAKQYVYPIFL
jgi:hypothetical protein